MAGARRAAGEPEGPGDRPGFAARALRGIRRRIGPRWPLSLGAAVLLWLAAKGILRALPLDNDASAYISGALGVLRGTDIYAENLPGGNAYVYPPLLAVLLAPIVAVSAHLAIVVWIAANAAAVAVSAWLLERAAPPERRGPWLVVVPSLLVLRALDSNFGNGQANAVLLVCFAAAAHGLARDRHALAGLAAGLGAAFKIVPSALAAAFLPRGRRPALAWAAAGLLAGAIALPVLAMGPRRTWATYQGFAGYLRNLAHAGRAHAPAGRRPEVPGETLKALAHRYLADSSYHGSRGRWLHIGIARLDPRAADGIYRGLAGLVLAAALWSVWRARGRCGLHDAGALAAAVLLAAPYARKAYFLLLVVPYAYLLVHHGARRRVYLEALGAGILGLVALAALGGCGAHAAALALLLGGALAVGLVPRDRVTAYAIALSAVPSLLGSPEMVGRRTADVLLAHGSVGFGPLYVLIATLRLPPPGPVPRAGQEAP